MPKNREIVSILRITKFLVFTMFLILCVSCRQQNAHHHFKNGNAKFKLGNYQGAIEDYSKAINLNKTFKEAYYSRAICRSKLKLYEEALADYNNVLEFEPENLDALFNRAYYIKEQTGDFAGAIADYDKYITINNKGNNAFAYNNMGFAKYKTGNTEEALAD
ncbi:MAG: tetratricopeptide repeat protein, partial [Bacteroidales bacterium]|nr:tetratricopeptide repeat protein [Bacteroidales bacterium]